MTTSTVSSLTQHSAKVAEDQDRLQRNGTECTGTQRKKICKGLDQYGKLEKDRGKEDTKEDDRWCKIGKVEEQSQKRAQRKR